MPLYYNTLVLLIAEIFLMTKGKNEHGLNELNELGTMKIEELEKLKKGARLMDNINSYKFFIENTEKAMKDSEQIVSGILYTDGENKIRMPLSKEVTLKVIEMAIAEHKATIARLEKEFEEL